uniref:Si:dkey-172m14.2 n=1 Tax=Sinocyclocheilus rhinocerous TaxID=307959 RepID=A0A673FR02_9TELE
MSGCIKELSLRYDPINESNIYTSRDNVEGRVILEVTKEIKVDSFVVKLTGDAKVRWTEKSGDDERTYRDHERYFKLKQYFIQESSKKGDIVYGSVIRPGRHIFLFRFQLPQQNMPPSFTYIHGWVKYVFMVKLKRPLTPTSFKHLELSFVPRNDATNDHLLQPQSGTQDKRMKLFSSGKCHSLATVKLKYSLKQQQTFIAGIRNKRGLKYIIEETRDRIPSGEKSKCIVNMKLPHDLTVTIENCPPGGFQPYPPPQPNLVPIPGELPPPPAGLYDPTVLPHSGAAAGIYPNPHAIQPGFHLFPSAPVYDPKH